MKRILVDMDGVLADVYSRFFELHEEESGQKKNREDIVGLMEGEAFPELSRWVNTSGFFRTIPVMPDSQRVLKVINEAFDVLVVSMATEFPVSLTDKQLWLTDHFPFISWRQVVFCGNKSLIPAEIMIDDHFKNLDTFNCETILFTQLHNVRVTDTRHRRVNSWREIEKILLHERIKEP